MRAMQTVWGLALAAAAGTAAAATGEYWQLKQTMSIEGMDMPAMENRVCLAKDAPPERMVPQQPDSDCRMTDLQTRGNKTTFRFECTGEHRARGEGENEHLGPDAYRGRYVVRSDEGEMTMVFEGRRVGGACDPEAPMKQMQAQMAAAKAQACRDQGAGLAPPERNPQLPPELDSQCDTQNKSAYCEGVQSRQAAIGERRDFASVASGSGWRRAFEFCGLDAAALEKRYCDEAVGAKDYYFVADACEADARRIAATCAGRDGTSLSAAGQYELLPICAKYGPGAPVMVSQPGADASQAPGGQTEPPKKESALDKLKKGTKGLKDLMKIP